MLKESLSHALLRWGMERYGAEPIDSRWREDFTSAVTFLSDSLKDAPYDTRRIELWFRRARFCPGTGRIGRIGHVASENEGKLVIDKTGGSEVWFPPIVQDGTCLHRRMSGGPCDST
jgi:hypothetical protein